MTKTKKIVAKNKRPYRIFVLSFNLILNPNLQSMLAFNLHPIFKARGITNPFTFLVKNGLTYRSASNVLNNSAASCKFAHIEKLCILLNCDISDLFHWAPDNGVVYPENFPLKLLKRDAEEEQLTDNLVSLPYKEFKAATRSFLKNDDPQ